ncbi:hypothetical protein [Bartonella elizabethae]|uniref:hypothetical protein n=1 Tax=Bartonella elizabethae TaxID=807 RepID=UPI0002E0C1EA|nr:hypothetical protein [Bartonella elizabethae]
MNSIDQKTESDNAFATHLIEEYDAITKSIDGKLLACQQGESKAITGGNTPYCCYS